MKGRGMPAVGIIEPVGGTGGMEYYDSGLAGGLANQQNRVCLFTGVFSPKWEHPEFKVYPYFRNVFNSRFALLKAARYFFALNRSLRKAGELGIPLLQFHFFSSPRLMQAALTLSRWKGFKTVLTVHDVQSFSGESSQKTMTRLFQSADHIIVHNQTSWKAIHPYCADANRISIIPHGNYLPFFSGRLDRKTARDILGLSADIPVLLFFGQIKKVKGLDILLTALPAIAARFPRVKLIIAGKVWKDDYRRYRQQIRDLGIGDAIQMETRYIEHELVEVYLKAVDILILPYREIYQSGVVLLAMSLGAPVLASNIEGFQETVTDKVNGCLFKTGDARSLAENATWLLEHPEAIEEFTQNAMEQMRNHFDWDSIGARTLSVYRRVIDG